MLLVSDHTQNMIPRSQISAVKPKRRDPHRVAVLAAFPYMQQTGELLQAMWTDVGFKVQHHIYELPVLRQKRRDRDFDAESTAGSYRFDPDGWFSRHLLSTAPSTKEFSRLPERAGG